MASDQIAVEGCLTFEHATALADRLARSSGEIEVDLRGLESASISGAFILTQAIMGSVRSVRFRVRLPSWASLEPDSVQEMWAAVSDLVFAAMIAESMTNVSSARANRQQLHERVTGAGMDCGRSSVRLFRNSQLKNAPPVPASVWTSLDSVLALDRSLGLHQGADRTGRSQLGFLTEALQNAYEHGLSDGSKSLSGRVLLSARSINLHDEADALGDGDPIGAHIRELSAGAGLASAAVWTVFDQGVGVSAKYSGRERDPSRQFVNELADLHQAMSPGKSSARTKFSASRGLGFKNMGQAVVGERGAMILRTGRAMGSLARDPNALFDSELDDLSVFGRNWKFEECPDFHGTALLGLFAWSSRRVGE